MLLIIRYRGNMKKISVIIFIYFLFIAGVSAETFSTTNNYGWVSEALKYSYQVDWRRGNHAALEAARKRGWLKEATKHMKMRGTRFFFGNLVNH